MKLKPIETYHLKLIFYSPHHFIEDHTVARNITYAYFINAAVSVGGYLKI